MGSYNASGNDPDWSVQWRVRGDMIDFIVSAQTIGWVGIGFSEDAAMVITLYLVNTYTQTHTQVHTYMHVHTYMPIQAYV